MQTADYANSPIALIHDNDDLRGLLGEATTPVLVNFTGHGCQACHQMFPVLEEIHSEQDEFDIVTIITDDNQDLAADYRVLGLPTMILFEDGDELMRLSGAYTKPDLLAAVEPFV